MAQERPSRLSEWLMLLRERGPVVREQFREWLDEVREEPRLIWESPAVRYVAYAVGALVVFYVVSATARSISPPPPPQAGPRAITADFHVLCANDSCRHHFLIHRKFGFRGFPVTCPSCERKSGLRARKCNSPSCRGRWVAPTEGGNEPKCPRCGDSLG